MGAFRKLSLEGMADRWLLSVSGLVDAGLATLRSVADGGRLLTTQ